MKKTINVNIAGMVFTLDEDAYKLLYDYIEALQTAFKHNDEGAEIVKDIEFRIAEVLSERVSEGQAVITISDIEQLISRIGNPEDLIDVEITEEEEKINEMHETTPPPYKPEIRKKLFRDPQNSVIGGVCAGWAAYLGIDVVWVRLFLLLLILLKGVGFLLYIVFWIAMPCAVTPYQRMQMYGENPTLSNIGKSVTDTYRNEGAESCNSQSGIQRFFKILIRIVSLFFMLILTPVLFALGVALLACVVGMICVIPCLFDFSPLFDPNSEFSWNVPYILNCLWLALSCMIVLGVPMIMLWLLVLNNFRSNRSMINNRSRWSWLTIWIIGIIMTIISSLLYKQIDRNKTFRENVIEAIYDNVGNKEEERSDSIVITEETVSVAEDAVSVAEDSQDRTKSTINSNRTRNNKY